MINDLRIYKYLIDLKDEWKFKDQEVTKWRQQWKYNLHTN